MTEHPKRPELAIHLALIVVLVLGIWSNSWHDGLAATDLPGHVGLFWTLKRQFAEGLGLPLWTPDWYAGASLILAYLHPIFSLAALAPFAAVFGVVTGLKIGSSAYLALAGWTMYAWCLEIGESRRGALIGALIYALHPTVFVFAGVSGHIHQPVSMAIIPLVFLYWSRLATRATGANCILAAGFSALLFLDMQRFWLVFPYALLFYLAVALRGAPDLASRLRALGIAGAVAIGMAGLLCFPALPGFQERALLQWHHTDSLDLFRQRYSFPHLFALLDRGGWLARDLAPLLTQRFVSLPGQWYQGLVALLFIGVGAALLARSNVDRARRARLAWTIAAWMTALCLAFGVRAIGPAHARLLGELSANGAGGRLTGALLLVALGLVSWLGVSLYALRAALRDRFPRHRWQCDALIGALLIAFFFGTPFALLARWVFVYGQIRAPAHFAFPMLGFLLGVAACLVTPAWERLLRTPMRVTVFTALVVVLNVIDVLPYVDQLRRRHPPEAMAELRRGYRALEDLPEGRILHVRHYNPLGDMLGAVEAGRPSAWGWLAWSSSGYTSELIFDGVYRALADASTARERAAVSLEVAAELSGLANVRYLSRIASVGPPFPASTAFESIWKAPEVEIFENRRALPFAQFYSSLALLSGSVQEVLPTLAELSRRGVASYTLTDSKALDALPADVRPDFWHGVRAESLAPSSALPAARARRVEEVEATRGAGRSDPCVTEPRVGSRVALRCRFDRDGYLVIAESWSPSWQAVVDGEARPVIRLNHAFQGIRVSAGESSVEFRYVRSAWVRASLLVSALSWTLALVLGTGMAAVTLRRRWLAARPQASST